MEDFIKDHVFDVPAGGERLTLRLRHFFLGADREERHTGKPAVLFVHGGNSRSDTFLLPRGGVVRYLSERGFDVWLLDWRGSPFVMKPLRRRGPIDGSPAAERAVYTLDHVVEHDIPEGLRQLRSRIGRETRLSLVAHCLGAGIVSMAMGCGRLRPFQLDSVVLSTLGLFFEVPWNGWMKAEDFILERVISNRDEQHRWVDPKNEDPWPVEMETAFRDWPKAWNAPGTSADDHLLQRLTFMVGRPFAFERLDPEIHGKVLQDQFGPMHLGLYQHASQIIRRGYVGRFNDPDVIDRPRVRERRVHAAPTLHYFQTEFWSDQKVTLIGGAEDQVWHRDSVDLMYEWLRGPASVPRKVECRKHVVPGYRLQELYWAKRAQQEVYPLFLNALCS